MSTGVGINSNKDITPASIPSLGYAKKNFKPWQFRFIQIAFYLIALDSIYSVILGVIVFFPPLSRLNPGWFIAAIFSAAALNFISIPLFIIAYILYFVLLAQVESKRK
jgi:hypothetical protein